MNIDSESKAIIRHEINKLRDNHIASLPNGNYYDANGAFKPTLFEFNRGIIEGMKMVLDTLEPPIPSDTLSDEETYEPSQG